MTRPNRPAAGYATGPPPKDTPVLRCACGGQYRDADDSRAAHLAVFGHRPVTPPTTQSTE
jgi:hypothetical protein